MKFKTLLALIGAVGLIFLITEIEAQRGGRRGGREQAIAGVRGLELTDAQRENMQAIHSAHAKQMVQLRANLQIARMELQEALRKDDLNASDVKAKVAVVNKAQGKILEVETDTQLKTLQILTPEQRKQAREMRQNRGRRGQMGFRRGGRGGRSGRGGPGFRGRSRHRFQEPNQGVQPPAPEEGS